tara:strand:- start:397 stop:1029 length:633 start_codon:yes stop_codon:yes gene_type:complete
MLEQSEINALTGMFVCILSGLLIKYALVFANQRWVQNFHSTVTFLILPLITFVITKIISNNIALSLGMVGALSIVRFRNPVKNSLELVMYFALITIGIANSVNMKWALALTIGVLILIITCHLFRNTILIGKNILNLSFNEGEPLNTIEIKTEKRNSEIENSNYLSTVFIEKETDEYLYNLESPNKKEIQKLYEIYSKDPETKSIRVDYV